MRKSLYYVYATTLRNNSDPLTDRSKIILYDQEGISAEPPEALFQQLQVQVPTDNMFKEWGLRVACCHGPDTDRKKAGGDKLLSQLEVFFYRESPNFPELGEVLKNLHDSLRFHEHLVKASTLRKTPERGHPWQVYAMTDDIFVVMRVFNPDLVWYEEMARLAAGIVAQTFVVPEPGSPDQIGSERVRYTPRHQYGNRPLGTQCWAHREDDGKLLVMTFDDGERITSTKAYLQGLERPIPVNRDSKWNPYATPYEHPVRVASHSFQIEYRIARPGPEAEAILIDAMVKANKKDIQAVEDKAVVADINSAVSAAPRPRKKASRKRKK